MEVANVTALDCHGQSNLDCLLPLPSAPTTLSSLQKTYDALLDFLWKDQGIVVAATTTKDMILRQADHLHALQFICKFIVGVLDLQEETPSYPQGAPAINTSADPSRSRQLLLEQTLLRSQLLLLVLQAKFPALITQSQHEVLRLGDDIKVAPYKDHSGLYCFSFANDYDDDDDNILNFDRKALEEEEQRLLQMASTPVPGEDQAANPTSVNQDTPEITLVSHLQAEWTTPVYQECQERWKRQKVSK